MRSSHRPLGEFFSLLTGSCAHRPHQLSWRCWKTSETSTRCRPGWLNGSWVIASQVAMICSVMSQKKRSKSGRRTKRSTSLPTSRPGGALGPFQSGSGPYNCQRPAHSDMSWADRQLELARTNFFAGNGAHVPVIPLAVCKGRKALKSPVKQSEGLLAAITKHTYWVEDNAAAVFISAVSQSRGGLRPNASGRVIWFEQKDVWT